MSKPDGIDAVISQLCVDCGMCCNGVLFHQVRLQPKDSAKALTSLGFRLKRKQGQMVFEQPCQAWKQEGCAVYEDRPCRCRQFECRQVCGLRDGLITEDQASSAVQEAKSLVAKLQESLEICGSRNTHRPLLKRAAMLLDGVDSSAIAGPEIQALLHASQELESYLDREFRVESSPE